MPRYSRRIVADAPRDNRLGGRRARGGLTGKLVEIETLLAHPQVEVEHRYRDWGNRANKGIDECRDRSDDAGPEVSGETGHHRRHAAEEDLQRWLDQRHHDADDDQNAKGAPPVVTHQVPTSSQSLHRSDALGEKRRYRDRPSNRDPNYNRDGHDGNAANEEQNCEDDDAPYREVAAEGPQQNRTDGFHVAGGQRGGGAVQGADAKRNQQRRDRKTE